YRQHPQLQRFRECADPLVAVCTYLWDVSEEATARGYRFDRSRLLEAPDRSLRLAVTTGQLDLEHGHLRAKVRLRAPEWEPRLEPLLPHPLFEVVDGGVEPWERHRAEPMLPSSTEGSISRGGS